MLAIFEVTFLFSLCVFVWCFWLMCGCAMFGCVGMCFDAFFNICSTFCSQHIVFVMCLNLFVQKELPKYYEVCLPNLVVFACMSMDCFFERYFELLVVQIQHLLCDSLFLFKTSWVSFMFWDVWAIFHLFTKKQHKRFCQLFGFRTNVLNMFQPLRGQISICVVKFILFCRKQHESALCFEMCELRLDAFHCLFWCMLSVSQHI